MKSPIMPRQHHNSLHRLIQDATKALAKDLVLIENIMRDEIFHSTLDWQTREQLADAARQSFARLNEDRVLYVRDYACRMAILQNMHAESALREHDTLASRTAVANAEAHYQSVSNGLLVRLDETTPN